MRLFLSSILEWFPFQFLHRCCDAAVPTVVGFYNLAALLCTASKEDIRPSVCKSHTAEAYSRRGLTRKLYASSFVDLEQPAMFRLSIPRDSDAFFTALST